MAPGNEPQPPTVDAELDIDGQLDALLDQIDQAEPGLIARGVPLSSEQAASPEPVHESDEAHDPAGMDLASQIQQLLDDARTHHDASPEPEPVPAPMATPEAAASSSLSEPASASPAPAEPLNIQDIDQLLADEADQALSGDFETIHEVLAAEQLPEAQAATPEPEPEPASTPAASAASPVVAKAPPAPVEDELEGSFEEPDAVFEQAARQNGLSDDALAVAQELDDQPENRHRPGRATEAAASDSTDHEMDDASSSPASPRRVGQATLREMMALPELLRVVCEAISRPIASLSPQSRDMVGYVGLITLFWGGVALVAKLLFVMRG